MDQFGAKDLQKFPEGAKSILLGAVTIAAQGGKAVIAKPLHGFGSGVLEIALAYRGDAFRVVYAVHLVKDRLKRLKEALR